MRPPAFHVRVAWQKINQHAMTTPFPITLSPLSYVYVLRYKKKIGSNKRYKISMNKHKESVYDLKRKIDISLGRTRKINF